MDIVRWARDSMDRIRSDGMRRGSRDSLRPVYHKGLQGVSRLRDSGEPIFEKEWDLLVILDACRLDLMKAVVDEYEYIDSVESVRSLDSMTLTWMQKNFTPEYSEEMAQTVYICGNPFSREVLDQTNFARLEEVWKYVWEDPGTVPPRPITDRTIRAARETNTDRVIAHYMQPHCPFLSRPELTDGKQLDQFGNQSWRDIWQKLRDGDVSREVVWDGYEANLRLVLDELEVLLENIDAEQAVITSDHGNAVGEWGVYGHPPGMPMDCLREVPWIDTSATDFGTYEPELQFDSEMDMKRNKQLAALGYM